MTFLSRCNALLCVSFLLMAVSGSSLFSQEAGDTPANETSGTSSNTSNNAIVIVLPGNGSTSGNGRAPQGSRVFNNSKYLITGTEMTTSGFSGPVGSVGWRWNAPRPTGAGAPAAQSVATTGNLKVFLKDTTGDAAGLIGTFIDTNGVGYTKVIDATISITRTDTLEFTIDVPVGGPGTAPFTPTPGSGLLLIYVYNTTTPIATPLGAPTVFCTNIGALLTYQSQTANGTLGTASTFRPETRFGTAAPSGGVVTMTRNGLSKAIPDNGPTTGALDTIIVSGVPGGLVIKKITVKADTVLHTWIGDMIFTLNHLSATDTSINRIGRTGGTGFGNSCDNLIGTSLRDSAGLTSVQNMTPATCATGIAGNSAGFFSPYRPLSAYNGLDPNGMYILRVTDNAADDTGTLKAWSITIEYGVQTDVGDGNSIPVDYKLSQNYPNPFNPSTTIQYGLPNSASVNLKVYNVLGQEVVTLADAVQNAGSYEVVWNGRNTSGAQVGSGMYFYSLVVKSEDGTATFTNIKKMILLK